MKKRSSRPRAVVVTRPTEYESLLAQHATHGQVEFFLRSREQSVDGVMQRHARQHEAEQQVSARLPVDWRRAHVERADLDRFLWEPGDIVVAIGQDGLVANVAKYLNGQAVVGINPDPAQWDGVLVKHDVGAGIERVVRAWDGTVDTEPRYMVEATTTGGHRIVALNELFIGHRSHQSARYKIRRAGEEERQSSSGLIVSTGTGATGWARSIQRQRACVLELPGPTEQRLCFFVREAFPSRSTGCEITEGVLGRRESLEVTSRMNSGGVIFGDGIESDRIEFNWGRQVTVSLANKTLRLVL